mmetsp:Transcript_110752/g.207569  ORF Transcript_110752/g.207569 Transcript_110752/m.207569 type:complete len:257 (-) Transcript_110752:44-814(-)
MLTIQVLWMHVEAVDASALITKTTHAQRRVLIDDSTLGVLEPTFRPLAQSPELAVQRIVRGGHGCRRCLDLYFVNRYRASFEARRCRHPRAPFPRRHHHRETRHRGAGRHSRAHVAHRHRGGGPHRRRQRGAHACRHSWAHGCRHSRAYGCWHSGAYGSGLDGLRSSLAHLAQGGNSHRASWRWPSWLMWLRLGSCLVEPWVLKWAADTLDTEALFNKRPTRALRYTCTPAHARANRPQAQQVRGRASAAHLTGWP